MTPAEPTAQGAARTLPAVPENRPYLEQTPAARPSPRRNPVEGCPALDLTKLLSATAPVTWEALLLLLTEEQIK